LIAYLYRYPASVSFAQFPGVSPADFLLLVTPSQLVCD
jgi:hypothetical protein